MGNSVLPVKTAVAHCVAQPVGSTICGTHATQGVCGGKDGDTLVLVQGEPMRVTGDDELGFSHERTGEHVVIVGIGGHGGGDRGGLHHGWPDVDNAAVTAWV